MQVRFAGWKTQVCLQGGREFSFQNTEYWKAKLVKALNTTVRSNIPHTSKVVCGTKNIIRRVVCSLALTDGRRALSGNHWTLICWDLVFFPRAWAPMMTPSSG